MNAGTTALYTQSLVGCVTLMVTEWKQRYVSERHKLMVPKFCIWNTGTLRTEGVRMTCSHPQFLIFFFTTCYFLKEAKIRFIFILLWNIDHLTYNLELEIMSGTSEASLIYISS